MHPEWHETIIALMLRFRALKAEMDAVHQAWQAAVREQDFAQEVSLIAHEQTLLRQTSAVMSAFHQLIAQELMDTQALHRLNSPLA
jgi:hypothetical protein